MIARGGTRALVRRTPEPRPPRTPLLIALRGLARVGYPAPWVVERQAALLLAAAGVHGPPVPAAIIQAIGPVEIRRWHGLGLSGMASHDAHGWAIVLRAEDPDHRQRWTLLHELWHIISDPEIDDTHAHTAIGEAYEPSEHLANYFAACVLMPSAWIRRDWAWGLRDLAALSRRYGVHRHGIHIRLIELGLADEDPAVSGYLFTHRATLAQGEPR